MREFNYKIEYEKMLSVDIVALIAKIHEYKAMQMLIPNAKPKAFDQLLETSKIQSTEASNRIEGIITSPERLKLLARDKTMPKTKNEKEIAGYSDVLTMINENYDYIPLKTPIILQLHRDLYRYSGISIGGNYKSADNIIAEEHSDGTKTVRFVPVSAWETPEAMQKLCNALDAALIDPELDPLVVIPMFVLDFLCIHPFNDGNGRMSRLITLLGLYRAGYTVGKYISLEKLIADSKETYYEVLQESSYGWHDQTNDYAPFIKYMLGIIVAAYRTFESRVDILTDDKLSKSDRVRRIISGHTGAITKSEILELCSDISDVTVERTLSKLQKEGQIIKIGGGRYTKYAWNYEKE